MMYRLLTLLFCAVSPMITAQSSTSALEKHVALAQEAQARQDCATAAREYTAAVRLLPNSGELRANQGIALYCNDQLSEATTALQRALQLRPTLAVPHLFLGLASFRLSEENTAIKELRTAAKLMPGDVTANLWLGYAYLASHQLEDAIQQFDEVLHLQPGNVDAQYAVGEAYFELGRQKVRELERLAPDGQGVHQFAAQQEWLLGKNEAGAQQPAQKPWVNPREGQLCNEALDAEAKARAALQRVLDEAPGSDRAHQILGDADSVSRDNDAAIAEYEAVLKVNPKLPGVRLSLANCLMQVNRFKAALARLEEEQGIQPRSANVWASTGRVQQALGNDTDAVVSLKKAMALPDAPPAARLLLGKTLLRQGDAKSALPLLEEALHEGADASTTNYLLARAYRATGDHAAMQRALEAYHQNSRDAAERRSATALTSDPKAIRTEMTAQEVNEANVMSAKHD